MRIKVSSFVAGDLDAIADAIAQDDPRRALTFVQQIRAQILALGYHPLQFRLRSELADEVRMASVGRYGILFRIHNDGVRVERVVYLAHDLVALFPQDE